jgi:hypothetical protein
VLLAGVSVVSPIDPYALRITWIWPVSDVFRKVGAGAAAGSVGVPGADLVGVVQVLTAAAGLAAHGRGDAEVRLAPVGPEGAGLDEVRRRMAYAMRS